MKCKICGTEMEKSQYHGDPICSSKCFHENFWNETLDDEAIIIDGVCYHDGGNRPGVDSFLLGFSGRVFTIRMDDGREFTTNNLWHNGEVPKDREVSDNAVFIYPPRKSNPLF